MPLYIRDDAVDALAADLQRATGAPTKTEAVRRALADALAGARPRPALRDRLAPFKARARALGPLDPAADLRALSTRLWGEA